MDTPEKPAEAATPTSPATASEETPAAATPEAATTPAPGTTTTPTEESPAAMPDGKDAVGVEGYMAMRDAAFKEAAKKSEKPPAEAAVVEEPATPAEAAATAATTTTEPATSETAAPEPAATEPAATAEETAAEKSEKRIRLKGLKDGHLVEAANEIARAENISFTEAFERVSPKKAIVPEPKASTTAAAPAAAAETVTLRTRDEINADIAARKAEKKQAATDLDTGKMYESDEAIETLRDELKQVDTAEAAKESQRQTAAQTEFATSVDKSKADAVKNWPESGDKESAFSKRMEELADSYEQDANLKHHVFEADAPFFFADLVAKEMKLLPKHLRKPAATPPATTPTTQPSTPAATKPAPVNQRAVVRPTQTAASPASGAARTTQEEPADTLGVDKVQSAHDYDLLKKRLKIPSLAQAR